MWLKKTNGDGPLKESQWPPSGQINELCKFITQHRLCENCVKFPIYCSLPKIIMGGKLSRPGD